MESRKYQLQKQIIEALKANDNDLYVLLKSQWAHRFGVESLEELKNLDLTIENQKATHDDDGSQNNLLESDKDVLIKEDDNKEKEITNQTNKLVKSDEVNSQKSYEIVENENQEKTSINPLREYKNTQEVEALIPLPPKPKYSFLRKWLFSS